MLCWIVELGSRYEYFQLDDKNRQKPVFRAGLNKQLGKATFWRASYGEGFRFPSMAELFTKTSTGNVFVQREIVFQQETKFLGRNFRTQKLTLCRSAVPQKEARPEGIAGCGATHLNPGIEMSKRYAY